MKADRAWPLLFLEVGPTCKRQGVQRVEAPFLLPCHYHYRAAAAVVY